MEFDQLLTPVPRPNLPNNPISPVSPAWHPDSDPFYPNTSYDSPNLFAIESVDRRYIGWNTENPLRDSTTLHISPPRSLIFRDLREHLPYPDEDHKFDL